ncbi:hypothetical protein EMQ25_15095 [Arsenicitalea aurantiaca]|uniref:Uncharacterized protein n=1 Tax=Arsenicitalea aurantiaca TaxID=1783274 RepID=A0A433X5W4_9HYPH|nr:hypothetical protein [Arsenicitalea aurantiaca]RUT29438.1 hypothetical protein EMQ25_15095 [Arsenicitalea aurantiaca]
MLTSEPVESFALGAGELHLLARGNVVLWVGSSEDLVLDPSSRARFRLALDCADRAFRVRDAIQQSERATIAWDLEIAQAMPTSPVLRSAA